jgi:hypothetical protein
VNDDNANSSQQHTLFPTASLFLFTVGASLATMSHSDYYGLDAGYMLASKSSQFACCPARGKSKQFIFKLSY